MMKNLLFICLVFLISFENLLSQDWRNVKIETGEIFSVSCPDKYNCFAFNQNKVNYGPEIFKSTNQGKTWKLIYHDYHDNYPEVVLLNGRVGAAPDSKHCFIAWWDVPAISRSNDGGYTFTKTILDSLELYERRLDEFTMYDSNYGFANADYGYYFTKDGWKTFEKRIFNKEPEHALYLDSSTMACAFYWLNNILGCHFMIYYINENKWDTLFYFGKNEETNRINEIVKLNFLNDSIGFACGYQKTNIGQTRNGLLYRTRDMGHNWDLIFTENAIPNFGFNDIAFFDEKRGVLIGYLGKIFFTKDGGETWIRSFLPEEYDYQLAQIMYVTWAGKYPIIGTYGLGIFRYEGDFFGFLPEPILPVIQAEDINFGIKDIQKQDSLEKKVRINNISDTLDLIITGYSNLSESAFWTNLPVINTQNPLIIKPEQYYEYNIYFKPNEVRKYADSIVFFSNAKEMDSITYIFGEGIANPIIRVDNCDFGSYDIKNNDSLKQNLKIYNTAELVDLSITGKSSLNEKAFSTNLPTIDSLHPIIIKPKEYFEYTFYFKPDEVRNYKDSIVFYSIAKDSDNVAIFTGEGIDDTTSIDDNRTIVNQIKISPNPASEYIEILLPSNYTLKGLVDEDISVIHIYNTLGLCVTNLTPNHSPMSERGVRIDVSGLPDGVYFLKLSESSELSESYQVQKFVVMK